MRQLYVYKHKETGLYLKSDNDDVSDINEADTCSITQFTHFFHGEKLSHYKLVSLHDELKEKTDVGRSKLDEL